jgi:tetratricopeptide (TPR) repeat protein
VLVVDAKRRAFDGEGGADSALARALRLEPENVAARTLRARFHADVEEFAQAIREIDRALKASPNDAEALAFGAAVRYVIGDSAGFRDLRGRYATQYPKEAGVQVAIAELLGRVRQYARAAVVAREGAQLDPQNWRAHALLGSNLLRLGQVTDAKRSLETAFAGDPYDVWTKNTLDLLDTFGAYDEVTRGRFRFMIEKAESQLLSIYLGELAERAHATFAARYGFTPAPPIRIEVYRSHADFSVRTVGLAGLGALGVSFGNTVAFDSPAAKDLGSFNWGSTAWHELAHTFTLGATDMRIPRWLSEGLSVYEERRGRKGWGQNVTPSFLNAYASNRLMPASKLNDGFVRPEYPQQVIFSYYQASLVCEMIARDWGEKAIVDMLNAYRGGLGTEQVIQRVLKLDLQGFDRRFDAYMREKFGHALAVLKGKEANIDRDTPLAELVLRTRQDPNNYLLQVAVGRALMQRGDTTGAMSPLEKARAMFPEYGGGEGPYPLLVRAMLGRGDKRGAAQMLSTMLELGEFPHDAHIMLADLMLEIGDTTRAADALEGAMWVNPYDPKHHATLATLYTKLGQKQKAIRERLAIVALKPVDRADALYNLAVAYRDAGDAANARRNVLRALEEAPHFEKAQDLLLSLRAGGTP